jgi:DNA-binding NarL/FixJ family response regulator
VTDTPAAGQERIRVLIADDHALFRRGLIMVLESESDIEVVAEAHELFRLAAVPLRSGLPDPLSTAGRDVVVSLLSGRLRVRGLARHPATLARLHRLLSVS